MHSPDEHPHPTAVRAWVSDHVPRCGACGGHGEFLAASGRDRYLYGCERCGVSWTVSTLGRLRHALAASWPRCPMHAAERIASWATIVREDKRGTVVEYQARAQAAVASGELVSSHLAAAMNEHHLEEFATSVIYSALRELASPRPSR